MKRNKLKTTRPQFLSKLINDGSIDDLTMEIMKRSMYDTNELCYCVYTVLMEADLDLADIASMDNDGEAIAITFKNKQIAKSVAETCNKELVRYGNYIYKVKLKLRDKYIIATVQIEERLDTDEDEEE